jgi:hypothetical protein
MGRYSISKKKDKEIGRWGDREKTKDELTNNQ